MEYDLAAKAGAAFIDDHFELAVGFYFQAIAVDPKNPELFCDRAQANIKLKNFTGGFILSFYDKATNDDAQNFELSCHTMPIAKLTTLWLHGELGMPMMACFSLHEYQTVKTAFEAGSILAPEDARFTDWVKKFDKFIAEENVQLPTQSSELCSNYKRSQASKERI
ncbi:hypothetical protein SSX86_019545 [Deinandra increscens subsp. villosa]|uniref:Uncharacterized protein n=1 Tax=Deinandra increscens subsp. villosa TaxID=3103831 RepID=A0AAP0CT16_9ASTR